MIDFKKKLTFSLVVNQSFQVINLYYMGIVKNIYECNRKGIVCEQFDQYSQQLGLSMQSMGTRVRSDHIIKQCALPSTFRTFSTRQNIPHCGASYKHIICELYKKLNFFILCADNGDAICSSTHRYKVQRQRHLTRGRMGLYQGIIHIS